MKITFRSTIGVSFMLFPMLLQGCAHALLEQRLDAKVAQEGRVKSRLELGQDLKERISRVSGLTDDQKSKLFALRDSTRKRMDELSNQSLRLRAVLIKDIVSSSYDEDEVELIKRRIRSVEDQRVSAIFEAADQANSILGHETVRDQSVLDDLFFGDPHGRLN